LRRPAAGQEHDGGHVDARPEHVGLRFVEAAQELQADWRGEGQDEFVAIGDHPRPDEWLEVVRPRAIEVALRLGDGVGKIRAARQRRLHEPLRILPAERSEERRVGKEWSAGGWEWRRE